MATIVSAHALLRCIEYAPAPSGSNPADVSETRLLPRPTYVLDGTGTFPKGRFQVSACARCISGAPDGTPDLPGRYLSDYATPTALLHLRFRKRNLQVCLRMARAGRAPVSILAEGAAEPTGNRMFPRAQQCRRYCGTEWAPFRVCGMKWASPSSTIRHNTSV